MLKDLVLQMVDSYFIFVDEDWTVLKGRVVQVLGCASKEFFHIERYWRGSLNKELGWYYSGALHKGHYGWTMDGHFERWMDVIVGMVEG